MNKLAQIYNKEIRLPSLEKEMGGVSPYALYLGNLSEEAYQEILREGHLSIRLANLARKREKIMQFI